MRTHLVLNMPTGRTAQAPAAAHPVVPQQQGLGQFKFDATEHVLVLDIKGLCAFPVDFETDGVASVRAFRFNKGQVMHIREEPGRYMTSAPWHTLLMPMYVYFTEALGRTRELAMAFVDFEMAAEGRTGVVVISYQLPLKGSGKDTARVTAAEDIAAFEVIPTPDSKHLLPHFAQLDSPMVQHFGVAKPSDSGRVVSSFKLRDRISTVTEAALASIEHRAAELRTQCARAGDQFSVQNRAKLTAVQQALTRLNPELYDVSIKHRILQMDLSSEPTGDEPDDLTSPVRASLRSREAELQRTQLRRSLRMANAAEETVPVPAPAEAAAPAPASAEGEGAGERATERVPVLPDGAPVRSAVERAADELAAELSEDVDEDDEDDEFAAVDDDEEDDLGEEERPASTEKPSAEKPSAKPSAKRATRERRSAPPARFDPPAPEKKKRKERVVKGSASAAKAEKPKTSKPAARNAWPHQTLHVSPTSVVVSSQLLRCVSQRGIATEWQSSNGH